MRINIYSSLDQDHPEFEINHPHNTGEINIFQRNLKHYEGLHMYENEQSFEIPVKNEAADINFKPSSLNTKENKKIDNKESVRRNYKTNELKNHLHSILLMNFFRKFIIIYIVRRERNIPRD